MNGTIVLSAQQLLRELKDTAQADHAATAMDWRRRTVSIRKNTRPGCSEKIGGNPVTTKPRAKKAIPERSSQANGAANRRR